MAFHVYINTDNDAFQEDLRGELARILHRLGDRVEHARLDRIFLYDNNGNRVGHCGISGADSLYV